MKKVFAFAAVVAILSASVLPAAAQQWPDKPVHILVPFPAGGGTDVQARLLSSVFQKSMGQNFIIDNRTGADGLIAAQIAIASPPDGNTIYFTSASLSAVVTLRAKYIKFDVFNDLVPVSWVSSTPLVLAVHPSVPARSPQELVALAKKKPGTMNGAGNTTGSTSHLAAEMFSQMTGIKTTILTYRGGAPAVIALMSGEVDYAFNTAPSIMPHLRSGKVRGIAVTTPKRSSALPDLPTVSSFFPGFEADNWYAMFYPKGTPRAIVDKLNAEIRKALDTQELRTFMPREALDPVGSSPEELAALLRREIDKYAKVIRAANIRVD